MNAVVTCRRILGDKVKNDMQIIHRNFDDKRSLNISNPDSVGVKDAINDNLYCVLNFKMIIFNKISLIFEVFSNAYLTSNPPKYLMVLPVVVCKPLKAPIKSRSIFF